MNRTLKKCPFCGSGARVLVVEGSNGIIGYQVECGNEECKVCPTTDLFTDPLDAREAWNERREHGWRG